jgi:hypothetical protein
MLPELHSISVIFLFLLGRLPTFAILKMQIPPPPEKFLPEIKQEILRHALTSPEPLSFCPLPLLLTATEFAALRGIYTPTYSHILRLALWNRCTNEEAVAKELTTTFSNLSLVSKDTRSLAQSLFFGENKWVLHVNQTFDAIEWISNHWGKEVLSLMRHVRIEGQALVVGAIIGYRGPLLI